MTLKHKLAFSSKARVALRLLLRSRLRQSTSNRLKLVFTDPQCKYWSNHLKKALLLVFHLHATSQSLVTSSCYKIDFTETAIAFENYVRMHISELVF